MWTLAVILSLLSQALGQKYCPKHGSFPRYFECSLTQVCCPFKCCEQDRHFYEQSQFARQMLYQMSYGLTSTEESGVYIFYNQYYKLFITQHCADHRCSLTQVCCPFKCCEQDGHFYEQSQFWVCVGVLAAVIVAAVIYVLYKRMHKYVEKIWEVLIGRELYEKYANANHSACETVIVTTPTKTHYSTPAECKPDNKHADRLSESLTNLNPSDQKLNNLLTNEEISHQTPSELLNNPDTHHDQEKCLTNPHKDEHKTVEIPTNPAKSLATRKETTIDPEESPTNSDVFRSYPEQYPDKFDERRIPLIANESDRDLESVATESQSLIPGCNLQITVV